MGFGARVRLFALSLFGLTLGVVVSAAVVCVVDVAAGCCGVVGVSGVVFACSRCCCCRRGSGVSGGLSLLRGRVCW